MSSYAEHYLVYRVANADVYMYPFPHFYVENVFPADFYAQMREHFPTADAMPMLKNVRNVGPKYSEQRLCVPLEPGHVETLPQPQRAFWAETAKWLLGDRFFNILMQKFQPLLADRFKMHKDVSFATDALLVDDHTRYALAPHTDSPMKVLTLLFYLPADRSQEHLGTSIYLPRDPRFRCVGGANYQRDAFELVYKVPFRPNTLFGFVKTSNSFHGVEPLNEDESCRRQLLLYDVNVPAQFALGAPPTATPAPPAAAPAASNITFRF